MTPFASRQMVVIDQATGAWAAMSAVTCLEGNDYAYNLHTGVDKLYRGRKLAQAVKVLALRYARDVKGKTFESQGERLGRVSNMLRRLPTFLKTCKGLVSLLY